MNPAPLGAGIFFIVAGCLFLLDELDVLEIDLSYVLPVVLIAVGLVLLLGATRNRR